MSDTCAAVFPSKRSFLIMSSSLRAPAKVKLKWRRVVEMVSDGARLQASREESWSDENMVNEILL